MSVSFYSLGAVEEVTGSKHVLEVDGRSYLIDYGAFQGKRAVADQKNRQIDISPDKVEAVILTHAHYDHCGLLPYFVKNGYKGNIYATPATRSLANLIMMDSAHIQARDAEFLRKKAKEKGKEFDWEPLFTESDVTVTSNQMVGISYHRPISVGPDVKLEFFDAGHILGSAMALITVYEGKENEVKILFTGDLGRKNKPIIRDPDPMPAADYVVLESTYGNRLHESHDEAMAGLGRITTDIVKTGGKIIIPSFAVERTQELIYYFHLLQDAGAVPEIPIFIDSPMAVNATSIFQVHPECYDKETYDAFLKHHKNPFGFNMLSFISNTEESKALNDRKGPMIIISADGMCEAGRILHHLANNIEKKENTILIVGYMAENTLGRRIKNRAEEVKIFGEIHPVRAKIEEINAFSAHADYKEIGEWLDEGDDSRLKRIFLVHGEPDSQNALKKYLLNDGWPSVEIVRHDQIYTLR